MQKKHLSEGVKKNLLDLHYTRYLQYYTTSIIILFTYFIGVAISFITKQINYKDPIQLYVVSAISISVIAPIVIFMLQFRAHLKNIQNEVRKLNL